MTTEKKNLKVFFLEDNPNDVELEVYELQKSGFDLSFEVARNRKEFLEKLQYTDANIILADYMLPDITGIEAINICREKKVDIPIIFITGQGNEQIAVDSLREGAIDYILKKNIVGLPARFSRALEIWQHRKAKERAEEDRQRFQQMLFQAQKMESVGRLASGIAHDFNNILTGILGTSELMLQDISKDSPYYEKLQTISTLCQRGASLVRRLLIFGRKFPLEFKRININSFIEETIGIIRYAVKSDIEIKSNLRDNVPEIFADTGQLSQMLLNMSLNAAEAMDGKGVLEIETKKYSISRHADKIDEYACLSMSDTGRGIPDTNIPKIFDPFFTTKEVGRGTGLGLTIVYSIVNSHGGWINVDSKLGKGTTFTIYFPVARQGLEKIPIYAGTEVGLENMKSSANETILFVEDNDEMRIQYTIILNRLGYSVLSAKNYEEALNIYSNAPQKIDLVISNIVMPNRSGMELYNELKSIEPDINFIFVADYGLDERSDYFTKDVKAVIKKPYNIYEIARVIKDVFQKKF
jgi:two-component system cell cycle sensor histidine kinase/response regulator CckA